jgi:hypothetical protein
MMVLFTVYGKFNINNCGKFGRKLVCFNGLGWGFLTWGGIWALPCHNLVYLHFTVKCTELIAQKDKLIKELREELKLADDMFIKDQGKQKEDLWLLAERIENQLKVMRNVYKNELQLIEVRDVINKKNWVGQYLVILYTEIIPQNLIWQDGCGCAVRRISN